MRRIVFALLLSVSAFALAQRVDYIREHKLGTSSATEVYSNQAWRGRLIQNRGPNSIFCSTGPQSDAGSGAVFGGSLEIASGGSLYLPGMPRFYCLAATAAQVDGGTTIIMGVP